MLLIDMHIVTLTFLKINRRAFHLVLKASLCLGNTDVYLVADMPQAYILNSKQKETDDLI